MTRDQIIARNDLLRTQLRGGLFRFGWSALHLDPQIRARATYVMTQPYTKPSTDDHSYGEFKFAGYLFSWHVWDFAGEAELTLDVDRDLLWGPR